MKRTPLRRSSPLANRSSLKPSGRIRPKPRAEEDKVQPGTAQKVKARDGRCMAPYLDRELQTPCADAFGNTLVNGSYGALMRMHLDHVPDLNGTAMGDRPPSDEYHLIVICPKHHLGGWATSVRGRTFEREYLLSLRTDRH